MLLLSPMHGRGFFVSSWDRFLALSTFDGLRKLDPEFVVQWTLDFRFSGLSQQDGGNGRPKVTVFDHPFLGPAEAEQTILHEMVHALGRWRHDRQFRTVLVDAVSEAYPTANVSEAAAMRHRGAIHKFDLALVRAIHGSRRSA